MKIDKYQQAWKTNAAQTEVKIDRELLAKAVRESHRGFQSTTNWRDCREVGVSILLLIYWVYKGLTKTMPWTWWLTVPGLIWIAGYIVVDRKRHPQRTSAPGEPLSFYAREALTQVEHQIWLLRNVLWWYLLPLGIPMMAFFIQTAWNRSTSWWGLSLEVVFWCLFTFVVYWVIYWLNQHAVKETLEPRRQDLLKLVAGLDTDSNSGDSDEAVDLMSAFVDPTRSGSFSWDAWATRWNQTVPSWRVAAAIIVPTLAGGLCGLFSGLWLRISEMGPTFFQAVVGAVIPFEFTFFWFVYLHYRRKKQMNSAILSDDRVPLKPGTVRLQSEAREGMRLPQAPAFVILVLTIAMGVLAILAVISFATFEGAGGDSPFDTNSRLQIQELGDISAFNTGDVSRIDSWLQKQVDLAHYPSLAVAIIRDGETIYERAIGFEDIKSNQPATLETQYRVASVTKVFTASLAVMLHEQGVVDLDSPVAKYLPDHVVISTLPDLGATITLRQLASHTSGLPRSVPGRVQSVDDWYELEPQRLYDHLASVTLEFDPGTKELYSNLGFGLLGHALERAAKKPLDQLVRELICDPLQLTRTAIPVDDTVRPATGYDDSGRQREKTVSFRKRLAGSGGLVTSVKDLARFVSAQMEPGILTSEMLEELHAPTKLADGSLADTALGWSVRSIDNFGPYCEKNGGRSNCSAWIGFALEPNVGVVVATNCGGPNVDHIGRWLLQQSIPLSARKLVRDDVYAKVAPFTGVRWEGDQPIVCVQDTWSPLLSINDIPTSQIMEFANKQYDGLARKRFAEDLVEVLTRMGHQPDWHVTLELKMQDGSVDKQQVLMTKENRDRVWNQE